jgi:hypothetical protein
VSGDCVPEQRRLWWPRHQGFGCAPGSWHRQRMRRCWARSAAISQAWQGRIWRGAAVRVAFKPSAARPLVGSANRR